MEKTIEIPEGYEACIEGNKVILEPKDERVRKEIISFIKEFEKDHYRCIDFSSWVAYLEKQKEQKPAEWSEEDETAFGDLMWCIEQARKTAKDENDMGNIWFAETWAKNRIKSLHNSWKPNEEQMEALWKLMHYAVNLSSWDKLERHIESLYADLKKL